jgi:hypothetical protein
LRKWEGRSDGTGAGFSRCDGGVLVRSHTKKGHCVGHRASQARWRSRRSGQRGRGSKPESFPQCGCGHPQKSPAQAELGRGTLMISDDCHSPGPPGHIHLLISEPQRKNPSTVMQALKLGFARRVIAEAERHGESTPHFSKSARSGAPAGPAATHLAETILRFQRLERTQTHRETALPAPQPSPARVGSVAGTVALEQLPRLLLRGNGTGKSQRVGSPEDEDSAACA